MHGNGLGSLGRSTWHGPHSFARSEQSSRFKLPQFEGGMLQSDFAILKSPMLKANARHSRFCGSTQMIER